MTADVISFNIGSRNNLTKHAARESAEALRRWMSRFPDGYFILGMDGYDEDPGALWEFSDVVRYVRWFAKYADISVPTNIPVGLKLSIFSVKFLSLCGEVSLVKQMQINEGAVCPSPPPRH